MHGSPVPACWVPAGNRLPRHSDAPPWHGKVALRMNAPTVRTRGWWVLLPVFCCLSACTPPPGRAAIPTPVWFEPTPDPVIEFIQPDWQTLDHADFPVYDRLETPPRLPDPAGIDPKYNWKLIYTLEHWEDPEPNFAGRFAVVVHGCGTNCRLLNFIDLSSGVWRSDLDLSSSCGMSWESGDYPYEFESHVESRLLIVPCIGPEGEGYHYYEFTDDRLELIRYEAWDTTWNRGDFEETQARMLAEEEKKLIHESP